MSSAGTDLIGMQCLPHVDFTLAGQPGRFWLLLSIWENNNNKRISVGIID